MMKTQNMTNSPGDIVRKRPKHEIGSPSWQSIQKQVVQHHTEKLKANPMLQDQIVLALFGYVMPFVGSSSIIVGLETLKEEPHFFGPSMCSEIRLLLYWHIVMAGIMYFRHATTRTLLGEHPQRVTSSREDHSPFILHVIVMLVVLLRKVNQNT
eukprot:m.712780 g.712780  ORF g.712780 m.712780 type:complete len:154 (-) comp22965_c0_seq7:3534-3995(-)